MDDLNALAQRIASLEQRLAQLQFATNPNAGNAAAGLRIANDPFGGLVVWNATDNYNPSDGTGTYRMLIRAYDGFISLHMAGGDVLTIPLLNADPASPVNGQVWAVQSNFIPGGSYMGFGAFTYAADLGSGTVELHYKAPDGVHTLGSG